MDKENHSPTPAEGLDDQIEILAARIGSPWGEGATYQRDRAKTIRDVYDETLTIHISHLDDTDREEFKADIRTLIRSQQREMLERLRHKQPDPEDDNQFSPDGVGGWHVPTYKLAIGDFINDIDEELKRLEAEDNEDTHAQL